MNHAAANINVKVNKGSYLGAGNITNITVQSDGIALGGTFNAAQTTPGYTAFEDEGKPLSRTVTTTAGSAATDIMIVPSGKSAAITFLLTIDGIHLTATSAAVQLAMGNSYQYTLNLSDISTYMEISGFSVKPWTTVTGGALDLTQKETLSWDNVINGVYAVSKEGLPVTMDEADESCIAVALIVNDAPVPQRFMIEKNEILNESWDGDYSFEKGRLGSRGFKCHDAVIPNNDYKSWTNKDSYFSYFDGETMTAAISYNDYNTKGLLQRFNNNNNDNAGYNDWYIPEIGQWGLMTLYEKDIQLCLEKIEGFKIQEDGQYVTSTGVVGSSTVINWADDNRFVSDNFWDSYVRARFIRNIDDVQSSTLNFMVNSYIYQAEENMTWMQFLESSYYMGFYDYDDNYFEGFSFDNENIKIGNDYYLGWMDWEHDEFFKINKNDLIKDGEFYSLDY